MEIEAYLRATHGEDEEAWPVFAIVDDKEVVAEGHRWRGKFVRTRHDEGLTRARADELVSILSAEKALVVGGDAARVDSIACCIYILLCF